MVLGNHTVVVGELALDQLGHELHAAKGELGLVAGELHLDDGLVVTAGIAEQTLQFQHGLARQNHFLLDGHVHIQRGAGPGQTVTVSGHQAQGVAFGDEQNAV